MKSTKIFIGVFLTAFLIGITGFYLIPKSKSESQQIKIEPSVLIETITPEIEAKVQPKVFDVKHFWDGSEKEINRNFLETGKFLTSKTSKQNQVKFGWDFLAKMLKTFYVRQN